jgi:hypothetical protein
LQSQYTPSLYRGYIPQETIDRYEFEEENASQDRRFGS